MKPPQYLLTLIISAVCVILSCLTWWQGHSLTTASTDFETKRNKIQQQLQNAQTEVQRGQQAYQILQTIVQEIMITTDDTKPGGVRDDKLRALIKDVTDAGFKINEPSPSPSPSPK